MKKSETREPCDPVSKLIQVWKMRAPLPPRFQERVWTRIARSETEAAPGLWHQCLNWVQMSLPRPRMAASYLMILLLTGVTGGYWRGQEKAARFEEELNSRYVQSVDPYQALEARK